MHLVDTYLKQEDFLGEANSGWNRDMYNCTFPALINEWRNIWTSYESVNNPEFPFGFMQLSTNQANDAWPGFSVVRWHQTADFGFVPNQIMKVSFD